MEEKKNLKQKLQEARMLLKEMNITKSGKNSFTKVLIFSPSALFSSVNLLLVIINILWPLFFNALIYFEAFVLITPCFEYSLIQWNKIFLATGVFTVAFFSLSKIGSFVPKILRKSRFVITPSISMPIFMLSHLVVSLQ